MIEMGPQSSQMTTGEAIRNSKFWVPLSLPWTTVNLRSSPRSRPETTLPSYADVMSPPAWHWSKSTSPASNVTIELTCGVQGLLESPLGGRQVAARTYPDCRETDFAKP